MSSEDGDSQRMSCWVNKQCDHNDLYFDDDDDDNDGDEDVDDDDDDDCDIDDDDL